MSEHSPLPWGIWKGHSSIYSQIIENKPGFIRSREAVCECDELDRGKKVAKANAKFIVTACNSYYALTAENEALRELVVALEAGLRRMADPIVALLNETPRGHVFDGEAAARIVDNPHWYRDAARALLSNEKGGR